MPYKKGRGCPRGAPSAHTHTAAPPAPGWARDAPTQGTGAWPNPEGTGIASKTHKSSHHMLNRALVYKLILNQGGEVQRSQDKRIISLFTSGSMEKISSRRSVMKQREKPSGLYGFFFFPPSKDQWKMLLMLSAGTSAAPPVPKWHPAPRQVPALA